MTDLRHLLEQLRSGARPPLSVDDVELLLGWLTGSAARDGEHSDELPQPGHDPVLLQMVLHRLDDVLFDAGELKPAAAGLNPEEPATRRRIRFRRLVSAFHPDRFPDLADWLTQRSQAVHRAYARFKQDPDAPAVAPTPGPYPPAQAGRKARRTAPRVRKHRLRAFANQLRARFGNDRYLAHKLIGGLALLALLPVLNMVLVPGKDPVDGLRSTVQEEEPVSDNQSLARQAPTPVEGSGAGEDPQAGPETSTDVGAGLAGDDGGPETQSLAKQAPVSVASPGAGEDPQTGRDPSTGVGAGLAGDDVAADAGKDSVGAASSRDGRGPEPRIASAPAEATATGRPARKPETGNPKPSPTATDPEITPLLAAARRAMNPNGEIATVAALQTVDEQLAAMGLENDTERLYRRIGGEEKPVSGNPVPVSGEDPGGAAPGSGEDPVGAGSGRDERSPETRSLARQAPTPVASPEAAAAPVGAASSRDSGFVGAGSGRDQSAPEAPPTEQKTNNQQPELAASQQANQPAGEPATVVGAGLAGDDRGPDTRSLAGQAPTPVASPEAAEPDTPARKASTVNRRPAPQAQPDSELVLGPLGRHPAGEVLQRFHAAMQAGNIAGIAGSFAPDARMDSLRGRDEIADHFRSALNPADSRRVNLKVRRLGREDGGWRVEADLDVRVERSGERENLLAGRSNFLLTGRGDQLLISRMDIE